MFVIKGSSGKYAQIQGSRRPDGGKDVDSVSWVNNRGSATQIDTRAAAQATADRIPNSIEAPLSVVEI